MSKLRKSRFATDADIEIQGAYGPADAPGDATPPGAYPFTRGVQETMYRGQLWTMRQYAGFGTAAESNRRYKYLLAQGGKGLSVAFDLPTQMGRDSDHAMARGEVEAGRTEAHSAPPSMAAATTTRDVAITSTGFSPSSIT